VALIGHWLASSITTENAGWDKQILLLEVAVSHPGASTNRSVLLTSRRRLRKPRGNVMLVLSANGRPSSFSSFEPSRIVDSTAAADGENVGHIQDCGTSSG
jgi:hypothetical protein